MAGCLVSSLPGQRSLASCLTCAGHGSLAKLESHFSLLHTAEQPQLTTRDAHTPLRPAG